MKKTIKYMIVSLMVVLLAACGGKKEDKNVTTLEYWTFQEAHAPFFEEMAVKWNEENPDRKIKINANVLPYDDMHNKLLIAFQTGSGAPDLVDIEFSKFSNYLNGDIALLPMNDYIEPIKDKLVTSRLDIYSKDNNYYAIDFHVGATVAYYNTEIMDAAGVDIDKIITWDDYYKAGEQVKAKTGKVLAAVETSEQWSLYPELIQSGVDFIDEDGNPSLDTPELKKVASNLQGAIKNGSMVASPGGFYHSEEFYGFMNSGEAASLIMPLWYMNRFTDYMPDLDGKIAIRQMPTNPENPDVQSVGLGGTGTAVTKYTKDQELAQEFLAYAKLSDKGNILIWEMLGFDPIRKDVWESADLQKENKFTKYFINNPFDILKGFSGEITSARTSDNFPKTIDEVKTKVAFQLFEELKDPSVVLPEAQKNISK